MTGNKWASAAQNLANLRKSDILMYNGPISDEGFNKIFEATGTSKANNCFLIMTTHGGDADSAYRIGRCLQRFYSGDILFFPPSICASAGTLVSVCASIVVLSFLSELGPLDVQKRKANQITGRKSGLTTSVAFQKLREESFSLFEHVMLHITRKSLGNVDFLKASEISALISCGLMSNVYDKIDPEIIAENERDLNIAYQYGERLSNNSKNIDKKNLWKLVYGYPAHEFVIDREEIRSIFKRTCDADSHVLDLILALGGRTMLPNSAKIDVELLASPQLTQSNGGKNGGKSDDITG